MPSGVLTATSFQHCQRENDLFPPVEGRVTTITSADVRAEVMDLTVGKEKLREKQEESGKEKTLTSSELHKNESGHSESQIGCEIMCMRGKKFCSPSASLLKKNFSVI